jgi:hypothetical protein
MNSMDFSKTKPEVWMNEAQVQVTAALTIDEWFILNIQETGTDFKIYTLCFCMYGRTCVCVCVCVYVHACTVDMQWTIFEGIL